ncbi:uncharacterized protein METZ01_LOCUS322545, partial [marine metagenome]
MNKRINILFAFMMLAVGCLDVEYKDYEFTINPDGGWVGTITYRNIISRPEKNKDASEIDFQQLINDYYLGDALVDENQHLKNIEKELYIEDGVLVGKMT